MFVTITSSTPERHSQIFQLLRKSMDPFGKFISLASPSLRSILSKILESDTMHVFKNLIFTSNKEQRTFLVSFQKFGDKKSKEIFLTFHPNWSDIRLLYTRVKKWSSWHDNKGNWIPFPNTGHYLFQILGILEPKTKPSLWKIKIKLEHAPFMEPIPSIITPSKMSCLPYKHGIFSPNIV